MNAAGTWPAVPIAASRIPPRHSALQRFFATATSQAALTTPSRRLDEPSAGDFGHTAEGAPSSGGPGQTPSRSSAAGLPPRTPYRTPLRRRGHGVMGMTTPGLSPVAQEPVTPGSRPYTSPAAGAGGWSPQDAAAWRGLETPDRGTGFGDAATPGLSPVRDQHPSLGSALQSESDSGSGGSGSETPADAAEADYAHERPAVMGGSPASSGAASAVSTPLTDPLQAAIIRPPSVTAPHTASSGATARGGPEGEEGWGGGEWCLPDKASSHPLSPGTAPARPAADDRAALRVPHSVSTCAAQATSGSVGRALGVDSPLPAVAEGDESASRGDDSSTTSEVTLSRGSEVASVGEGAARGDSLHPRQQSAPSRDSSRHSDTSSSSGHSSRGAYTPAEQAGSLPAASDGAGWGGGESPAAAAVHSATHGGDALCTSQRLERGVHSPPSSTGGAGNAKRGEGPTQSGESGAAIGDSSASGADDTDAQSPPRGGRDTPMEYSESDRESAETPPAWRHSGEAGEEEEGRAAVETLPSGDGAPRVAAGGVCLEPDPVALALASSARGGSPSIDRGVTSPSGPRLGRTRSRVSGSQFYTESGQSSGAGPVTGFGAAAGLASTSDFSSSTSSSGHLLASFDGVASTADARPAGTGTWAAAETRPPPGPGDSPSSAVWGLPPGGASPSAGFLSGVSTVGAASCEEPAATPARAMLTSSIADDSPSLALLSPLPPQSTGDVTATPPRPRRTAGADDTALLLTARAAATPSEAAAQSQAVASPSLAPAGPSNGDGKDEEGAAGRAGDVFSARAPVASRPLPAPLRPATALGTARGALHSPAAAPSSRADGGALRAEELASLGRAPAPEYPGEAGASAQDAPTFASASLSSTWRRRRRREGAQPGRHAAGAHTQPAAASSHARVSGSPSSAAHSWVRSAVYRTAPHSPGEGASLCAPGVSFAYTATSSRSSSAGLRPGNGADSTLDWAGGDTRYVHLGSALEEAEVAHMDEETRWTYAKTVTAGDATAARLIRRSPVATAYLRRRVWGSATDGDRLRTRPVPAARGDAGRGLAASWSRRLTASDLFM